MLKLVITESQLESLEQCLLDTINQIESGELKLEPAGAFDYKHDLLDILNQVERYRHG